MYPPEKLTNAISRLRWFGTNGGWAVDRDPELTVDEVDLLVEALDVLEAARRVSFAFHGRWARISYHDRWDEFLPQHESLLALDEALEKLEQTETR